MQLIYNEGYTDNISESFVGYKKSVRIIYEHKIKKELASTSVDASIQEPFSVYISGIDVYGEIQQTSRSDVNIIATVNPKTHQIFWLLHREITMCRFRVFPEGRMIS